MKLTSIMLIISVCCVYAQADKSPVKAITVTGCVYEGVECLTLKDSKGKQDYSIAKTNNLQIGHAYRISGPVSDVGFCQEGKPILAPSKVTEVRLKCNLGAKPKN